LFGRRTAAAALLGLLAVTASACGDADPSAPTSPSPDTGTAVVGTSASATTIAESPPPGTAGDGAEPPAEVLPASWRLCQNPLRGSSMGYPGDWFTTSMGASDACSMFHPTAFTIPVAGEFPLVALNAVQTDDSLATYVGHMTDPMFQTTVRNEATTVLGLLARRFEVTSLGEGLDEVGTRRYGYVIDRGGRAFVIYTVARAGETRYDNWKFIVDTAKGTLRFL
jgi:hypothetical protein